VPICLLSSGRRALIATFALVIVVSARFGADWISVGSPSPPGGQLLAVVTWNLEVGSRPGDDTVAFLRDRDADIVALQELQPDAAAAIGADPTLVARYPYRTLVPRSDVLGLGILSRFPMVDPHFAIAPAVQDVGVTMPDGRHLVVINAHPLHSDIQFVGGTNLPIGFDTANRNADLVSIRRRVDDLVSQGTSVIVLGDLNTAASEPAFDRFQAGLRDVHREVGLGPGWTWRPSRLEFLGAGLVRIDHVVVSPDIVPLGIGIVCPPAGDHCVVSARVGLYVGTPASS
jgi:vancomycin resistance protein VanJ